jgi:hypothetical protein
VCEREKYKQTDRRRNKQSLAYLSQLLHLVGADVGAVSESKVEEEEEEGDRDTHTHNHRNTQTNLS